MGLNELLSRYAVRRAHVLVVEAPGAWVVRARLEAAVVERGWRPALSPGDADVLAVCGAPGPELAETVERLWDQLPGPRVRVEVPHSPDEAVAEALLAAAEGLADTEQHRRDARARDAEPEVESPDHDAMDHGDMDHQDMDHGDMDHQDMDHGDMEMAPGGIALAGGEEDRDGLEMDVLHLRLGPVLPHWPAGLVLRCTLQGDVITEAEGWLIDDDHAYQDPELRERAWRCDNIARLLGLAGWQDAAARARGLRDAHLCTATPEQIAAAVDRLRSQVTRSRTLRWSLRGLRPLTAEKLAEHGLPAGLEGDSYDRLIAMLDRLCGTEAHPSEGGGVSPDAVASVVVGLDLATARLVVASLDLPPLGARVATRA